MYVCVCVCVFTSICVWEYIKIHVKQAPTVKYIYIYIERERERDRQTDRTISQTYGILFSLVIIILRTRQITTSIISIFRLTLKHVSTCYYCFTLLILLKLIRVFFLYLMLLDRPSLLRSLVPFFGHTNEMPRDLSFC